MSLSRESSDMRAMRDIPEEVFDHYKSLGYPMAIDNIDMGLINKTYRISTHKTKYILQEISPIFELTINEDSQAVCQYLEAHHRIVPKIYPTDDGQLVKLINKRVFRALRFIDGQCFNVVHSLSMAESAGKILGDFHKTLLGFNYRYRSKWHHGGDYPHHKQNLHLALNNHGDHEYFHRVLPFANRMMDEMDALTGGLITTKRHVHGDPKISNIMFDQDDRAICLVDLDTLGDSGWSLEMASALRSWCNPNKEDVLDPRIDMDIADHAIKGYAENMRGHFTLAEVDELLIHVQAVTLCLAMRYLTDVLNETYWAYDRDRFIRPADHNWLRACAMHQLFARFQENRVLLKDMVLGHLF